MSDDLPPPQSITELLHDLEFAIRQEISNPPPYVAEALRRLDKKRKAKGYREYKEPPPAPPRIEQERPEIPAQGKPADNFQTAYEQAQAEMELVQI